MTWRRLLVLLVGLSPESRTVRTLLADRHDKKSGPVLLSGAAERSYFDNMGR